MRKINKNREVFRKEIKEGDEIWYDKNGKLIYIKYSSGVEKWYNSNNNETHIKYPSGYEKWFEYYDNYDCPSNIKSKDSLGCEESWEFDPCITYYNKKYPNGLHEYYEFEAYEGFIKRMDKLYPSGFYERYNEDRKIIYIKDPSGYEKWFDYYNSGALKHTQDSYGFEEFFEDKHSFPHCIKDTWSKCKRIGFDPYDVY